MDPRPLGFVLLVVALLSPPLMLGLLELYARRYGVSAWFDPCVTIATCLAPIGSIGGAVAWALRWPSRRRWLPALACIANSAVLVMLLIIAVYNAHYSHRFGW